MSRRKDSDKSDQAFRELIRVLEDAIQAGVDSVGLEYEDRNWIVYCNFGHIGLGAARIARELQWDVINQICERAGLSRKSSGKMHVCLLGKNYDLAVKTHESFGEWVYHLTLKQRQEKEAPTVKQTKQKKKPAARTKAPIRWEFAPDIPTLDFFEEGPLDEMSNLQEVVDRFVYWLEQGGFLIWEAVVCEEQRITLTPKQKKLLGSLLDFNDEGNDQILYIDEMPRPSEPWHVILNRIVPCLLIEPFRTFDCQAEVKCEGWNQIMTALQEHGQGLSLPPGVEQVEEVVPVELRHKLWLQFCFTN